MAPAPIEDVAHQTLHVGRLLLGSGADTAEVQESMVRFAAAFGCETHLVVTYEALLLTVVSGEQFRTKISHRVPAMNVNMAAVAAVSNLLGEVEAGRWRLSEAQKELDDVEDRSPVYGRWLIVIALGLTAASLARLFGGDWPTFWVSWLAGSLGMWLRQMLGRRGFNLFFIPFAAALLSGVIGGADIVGGTLIGALAVGFLAQGFARHFRAPAVAFAFPGVVAMIPGAFAFRAVIGCLQIVHTGAAAATALVTETLALAAICLLMVAAIAVGIVAPLILITKGTTKA